MEQNQNRIATPARPERSRGAPADESASSFNPGAGERLAAPPDPPNFEPPPLLSDSLGDSVEETLAETFTPESRKPRHDGWTPEAIAGFLRHLAATGIVEHAARAVGLSAQSAYAFRNRREGRAFARMWDALLVHRSRARIASELQARAIAGCVSIRKRDGEVVGEYHYYDNRLAMAMLTRLDRLAERDAPDEAHLRALSEDLDGFCECLAEGGDFDAFVEARKPAEPEPEPEPAPPPPDDDPELTRFAALAGCPSYREVHPFDIEVRDLDPTRQEEWGPDGWVRAFRSGFMFWLEQQKATEPGFEFSPGAPLRYHFARLATSAIAETGASEADFEPDETAGIETGDLDAARISEWTDDQLARAWRSGFLQSLPPEFWHSLAEPANGGEGE